MVAVTGVRVWDLVVGRCVGATNLVTEANVIAFAEVSGDHNPVHLSSEYASTTPFKERIAHGALIGAYISALVSTAFRGAVLVSLNLKFRGAVKLGEEVTTKIEVIKIDNRRGFVKMRCLCSVEERTVVKGELMIAI